MPQDAGSILQKCHFCVLRMQSCRRRHVVQVASEVQAQVAVLLCAAFRLNAVVGYKHDLSFHDTRLLAESVIHGSNRAALGTHKQGATLCYMLAFCYVCDLGARLSVSCLLRFT
jgi:hypothetical protein